jgi:REP element-mobilizing transposase RayT
MRLAAVNIDNRMARQPRNEVAGSTYHVTIHAVADTVIVRNDFDRTVLTQSFAEAAKRYHWEILALAILDTHYHAIVFTPEATLGAGMQYLNGTYAQAFNRRHNRKGHLFGARYFSKPIETEAHFLLTVRYIALNGFNAGLAHHPRTDRWNSYPRILGALRRWHFIAHATLLGYFSPNRQTALRKLVLLVEARDIHEERRRRRTTQPP